MKKILLSMLLAFSSASAVELAGFTLSPEIGANVGYQDTNSNFTYGGYARVWMGGTHLLVAPQVKYDVIGLSNSYKNLQAGGVLGVQFVGITVYAGASWSTFYTLAAKDTYAINYGIKIDVPFIPFLTVGVDASWQKPDLTTGGSVSMNRVGVTVGLAF